MPSNPSDSGDGLLGLSPGYPLRAPLGFHCCRGAGVVYRVSGKLQREAAYFHELPRDFGHLVGHPWDSSKTMGPLSTGKAAWVSGLQLWAPFLQPSASPTWTNNPKEQITCCTLGRASLVEGSVIWLLAPSGAHQTPTLGPGMCQGPKRSRCP